MCGYITTGAEVWVLLLQQGLSHLGDEAVVRGLVLQAAAVAEAGRGDARDVLDRVQLS